MLAKLAFIYTVFLRKLSPAVVSYLFVHSSFDISVFCVFLLRIAARENRLCVVETHILAAGCLPTGTLAGL